MKEFKSIGFNLDAMTPLLIPLFVFLYVPDMLDVFFNNYIYIIGGVYFMLFFVLQWLRLIEKESGKNYTLRRLRSKEEHGERLNTTLM